VTVQSYFYRDQEGREIGPLDLATLAKFRFSGVLNGDTMIRAADSTEWKPCQEVIADLPPTSTATVVPEVSTSGQLTGRRTGWKFRAFAVVALAIFVAIHFFMRAVDRQTVTMGLLEIDSAKLTWAEKTNRGLSAIPTANDLLPYLYLAPYSKFPVHPQGGAYVINAVKDLPESTKFGSLLSTDYSESRMKRLNAIRQANGE